MSQGRFSEDHGPDPSKRLVRCAAIIRLTFNNGLHVCITTTLRPKPVAIFSKVLVYCLYAVVQKTRKLDGFERDLADG